MSQKKDTSDYSFDIRFFESVLRQEPNAEDIIEILGQLYTKAQLFQEGLTMDRRMVLLRPGSAMAHYNLACSLALCSLKGKALRSLAKAVSLGYDDAAWMADDPDLISLREEPEFIWLWTKLHNKSGT